MRIFWSLLFLMYSGAALAAPSPEPPPEYSGKQYIDGRGCVFKLRNGNWQRQLDRDSNPVCGFPPTLSARRTDPETDVLSSMRPAAEPPEPEQMLREFLASELRQGEYVADPREVEERREPEPVETDDAMMAMLRQMMQLRAEVDAKLAGDPYDPGLCKRLGYVPELSQLPTPGGDVTSGLCPGQRPASPVERILTGVRIGGDPQQPADVLSQAQQKKSIGSATASVQQGDRPSSPGKKVSAKRKPEKRRGITSKQDARPEPDSEKREMIPASARYVQVGVYADDASAEPVIQRLRGYGYPVARGFRDEVNHRKRVVLAGPFNDRRTLIAALTLLRGKGYAAIAQ